MTCETDEKLGIYSEYIPLNGIETIPEVYTRIEKKLSDTRGKKLSLL